MENYSFRSILKHSLNSQLFNGSLSTKEPSGHSETSAVQTICSNSSFVNTVSEQEVMLTKRRTIVIMIIFFIFFLLLLLSFIVSEFFIHVFCFDSTHELFDPQIVQLEDGNYRIYVTAKFEGESSSMNDDMEAIVSATTQD